MATESTPLLSVSASEWPAVSARRQSLPAIAGGRQSEFGGPNKGLEEFRRQVARNRLLSRSEQRQDITEQVRKIIEDEPGLVAPTPRLDVPTSLREIGILVAWVGFMHSITYKQEKRRADSCLRPYAARSPHLRLSLASADTLSWARISSR